MFLRELIAPVSKLGGVGKKTAESYSKLGVETWADLLCLAPRGYDDRSVLTSLADLKEASGEVNTTIKIISHTYFGGKSKSERTLKVIAQEESGARLELLCFGRSFLSRTLSLGSIWYLNGSVNKFHGVWQTSSFTVYRSEEEAGIGKVYPIYPLSGSLTQNIIRKNIQTVLANPYVKLEDEMPFELYERYNLPHTDEAIRSLHFPSNINEAGRAKTSLAFTELLHMELSLKRNTPQQKKESSKNKITSKEAQFIESLPFKLTEDQIKCLKEIRADLDSPTPMNRLLQGDVGSGKTLIAWISALHVISQKGQVAFMAPTELLARQHAEKAAELLSSNGLNINVAFMTGEVKGKGRALLLENLKKGEVDIAIGTHALFSKDVVFKNLKLVIIDEQHRFGVEQRALLTNKGTDPNVLLMTATPIPRTLALTFYGDQRVSTIRTMPQGRLPIITHLVTEGGREKMYQAIAVEFRRGHQAYFVYPRIDDEGESNLRDVNNMYAFLKEKYPEVKSALIHSKLPEDEKMRILEEFRAKKISYLVSTSVVEVGLDIPDATCMVIEHAEHFGLAALHQLRGRVGRSNLQSYCFLVFSPNITEDGKARLKVMRESTDGFYIAEQDLLIRGPGDFIGKEQSGFLKLKFASLTGNMDLIALTSKEADRILLEDRGFILSKNYMLRTLVKDEDKTISF